MGRTRGNGLPAEVQQLRQRIERWRRTRERRTPMPAGLWAEAVRLARDGRAWAVARALGVNFEALRRRMAEAAGNPPAPGRDPPAAFGERSGAQVLGATGGTTGTVVELSDDGGIRLTVRLAAGDTLDVPRVVAAFRGVGA